MSNTFQRAAIIIVLIGLLLCLAAARSAFAEETASGDCGESAVWVLDSDGTLTIRGNGDVVDFVPGEQDLWSSCRDSIETVVIEEGITSIGMEAFSECSNLKAITIPDSVASIGDRAFYHCTALTEVRIPERVTVIGDRVFQGCTSLAAITLPSGLTTIGEWAFENCCSLPEIRLPESVTLIKGGAFDRCKSLTSITLPGGLTRISSYCFSSCVGLTEITIPDQVKTIGICAFMGCTNLKDVTIPEGVKSIQVRAFEYCDSLEHILLPSTLTELGQEVFHSCIALRDLVIPEGVTSLPYGLLESCVSLESVTIPASVTEMGQVVCGVEPLKVVYYGGTVEQMEKFIYVGDGFVAVWPVYVCSNGTIDQKRQRMTARARTQTIRYSRLKKKTQVIAASKAFIVKGAQGDVRYKISARDKRAKKKITVSRSGKVTVKKGLKPGKYRLEVMITAAGNDIYKPGSQIVTLTIKVK